jgi:hypothetical protein
MTLMRGRGVIIPVEWDENGNVVAIGISTHGEDEYVIEDEGKGEELKSLIRKEVEVIGEARRRDGQRMIKVKEYKVMEGGK